MAQQETLLYPVFNYLRRQGVPLGVSEYLAAVKALSEGVGIQDVDQLGRFCRLLWAKSREDQELFDVAFAELVQSRLQVVHGPAAMGDLPERASSEQDLPEEALPEPETGEPGDESELNIDRQAMPERRELRDQILFRSVPVGLPSLMETGPAYQSAKYHFTPRLPIARRDMAGAWRHFRRLLRTGPAEELDVEGTIQDICRTGFYLRPVLRPRRRNQAGVVLLIDRQGSMAPFSPLIEAFRESVSRGGLLGRLSVYYFHDCPKLVLYEEPSFTSVIPLEQVLTNQAKDNGVMIVSDAGAARGSYDSKRLQDTRSFLRVLSTFTYLYAWINPVPPQRWWATTAEDIAHMVPMFYLDRDGLDDAIQILRGHPFPPGVGIDG